MKITSLDLQEVLLVEPDVFADTRGFFVETWNQARYQERGILGPFVQDNLSRSERGTLRGLHLQEPFGQGKLVQVLVGEVFDVAVDVRLGSPTFGRWVSATLSEANKHQLYVPAGFAHGFCVTSEQALFAYKCTELYHREAELMLAWNDPDVGIAWPMSTPNLSEKDSAAPRLRDIPVEKLPRYRGGT